MHGRRTEERGLTRALVADGARPAPPTPRNGPGGQLRELHGRRDALCLNLALRRPLAVPRGSAAGVAFPAHRGARGGLAGDLAWLLDGPPAETFPDVALVVEGKELLAHRAVLAARSDAFRAGLAGGWAPAAGSGAVGLAFAAPPGVKVDALRAVLRYLYTGAPFAGADGGDGEAAVPEVYREDLPKDEGEAAVALVDRELRFLNDVLTAAAAYGAEGLRQAVARRLAELAVTPAVTALVAGLALAHGAPELLEFCVRKLAGANPFELQGSLAGAPAEFRDLVRRKREELGLPSERLVELQRAVFARDWARVDALGAAAEELDAAHALHHVCAKGDAAGAEALLERGCRVNVQDRAGRTPLHHALLAAGTEAVTALLARGANPHVKDDGGEDPLEALENHRERLIADRKTRGVGAVPIDEDQETGWAESYMLISEHSGKVLAPLARERAVPRLEDDVWVDRAGFELLLREEERSAILSLEPDPAGLLVGPTSTNAHGELLGFCVPNTCLSLLELEEAATQVKRPAKAKAEELTQKLAAAVVADFDAAGAAPALAGADGFRAGKATGFALDRF